MKTKPTVMIQRIRQAVKGHRSSVIDTLLRSECDTGALATLLDDREPVVRLSKEMRREECALQKICSDSGRKWWLAFSFPPDFHRLHGYQLA